VIRPAPIGLQQRNNSAAEVSFRHRTVGAGGPEKKPFEPEQDNRRKKIATKARSHEIKRYIIILVS
jgi:hypothetical protein